MRTFAAYLLDRGAVGLGDLDRASQRQTLLGGDLGAHLLGTGAIDEPVLLKMWSEYCGRPAGPAGRLGPPSADLEELLPLDAARRYAVFPLDLQPHELRVATDVPLHDGLAQELSAAVGRPVTQLLVSPLRLREAYWRYGGQPLPIALRDVVEALDGPSAVEEGPSILGPRTTVHPASKQTRPYRRMVETAGQKVMPADRSSSVSLLSAMVASRLGPANAEAEPPFERSAPEPFDDAALVEPLPAPEPAAGPVDAPSPPVVAAAAVPPTEAEDRDEAEGPDTERDRRRASERDRAAAELPPEALPAPSEPAVAAPADAPGAPVFVEWREVAGLVELDVDRGDIPDAIGGAAESDRPTGRPAAGEGPDREERLTPRPEPMPARPTEDPAAAPEIVATELDAPESADLASLVAEEPAPPPSFAPSSQSFRHRGPFPRVRAEVALETAATVGQVLDIFVRFSRQYFERMVLWTVQSRRAEVRQCYGMPTDYVGDSVDLEEPSMLRQAHDAAQIVVAAPTGQGFDQQLREELGLASGVTAVVVPIRVRQRVVALLYADDVDVDVDRDAVAEVAGFANLVGNALAAIIVRRKRPIPF